MSFADLNIPKPLLDELTAKGYVEPTAVQIAALRPEHLGRDLLVSSKTGSGKTIAFGLAVADLLLAGNRRGTKPKVLVVAPTRELAQQVARELSWLFAKAKIRVALCVGGMDPRREAYLLKGGSDIVVGTPGRLCDHLNRGVLVLDECEVVVLDEADEMLDMGFREDLEKILDAAPDDRRTLMFSATVPPAIESLARKYTKQVVRVMATSVDDPHEDIETVVHLVAPGEREHAVVNVLRARDAPSALVFCATRDGVAHLAASLVERGFAAAALSGELSQAERNRAIQGVRDGRARVLVATDVAARGLDLPSVALVVHADLPHDASVLRHRSGRTGRAGKKGTAVVLVPFSRKQLAARLLHGAGISVKPSPPPTLDDVKALDAERLRERLKEAVLELDEEDVALGKSLAADLTIEQLAALVVRGERRALPAAEDLPMTTSYASGSRTQAGAGPRDRARPTRGATGPEGVWFLVNVGRDQRADPKWLVPLICRRGGITKRDIGRIEIGPKESRFEVNPSLAQAFERASFKRDAKEPHVRFSRMGK